MKVKTRSRANLTDANKVIETIVCRLFNSLFGWQLINLNMGKANFPAADLGDTMQRVAVQVTNEESSDKITQTCLKAERHGIGANFDRLIVFFLLARKPGWPKRFVQPKSGPEIEVWDIADVLNMAHEISELAILKKSSELLDQELEAITSPRERLSIHTTKSRANHDFDHGKYGLDESEEILYSSFLEVTFPSVINLAETRLKHGVKFKEKFDATWASLTPKELPSVDYHNERGTIYTFDNFDKTIWRSLIADRVIKPLPSIQSATLAESEGQGERNLFIKILQRNLEHLCNHIGTVYKLVYSKDLKCYLFQAETDKRSGMIKVQAIKKSGTREVFKAILNTLPDKEKDIQHWKHQAFRHKFMTFGGKWYLNLEPFWAFTCDGKGSPSRWHKTSSRNMKKPERNRAVLGHIMFWASLLCKEADMLSPPFLLKVHRSSKILVSPSILDDEWKTIAPSDEKTVLINDSEGDLLIL